MSIAQHHKSSGSSGGTGGTLETIAEVLIVVGTIAKGVAKLLKILRNNSK